MSIAYPPDRRQSIQPAQSMQARLFHDMLDTNRALQDREQATYSQLVKAKRIIERYRERELTYGYQQWRRSSDRLATGSSDVPGHSRESTGLSTRAGRDHQPVPADHREAASADQHTQGDHREAASADQYTQGDLQEAANTDQHTQGENHLKRHVTSDELQAIRRPTSTHEGARSGSSRESAARTQSIRDDQDTGARHQNTTEDPTPTERRLIAELAHEQQAHAKQLPARYPSYTHLVPTLYPPCSYLLPAFFPSSCATVASMSTFYRFPYRLTGSFTDRLQTGYRSVSGRFQAPPATVTPRNGGTAA
jgi:hypothetical protein